jgi:hypothetical protein
MLPVVLSLSLDRLLAQEESLGLVGSKARVDPILDSVRHQFLFLQTEQADFALD